MDQDAVNFLQILNVLLTSGVLIVLIGAAVKYGQLTQEVKTIGKDQDALWVSHKDLDGKFFEHISKERKP